jgi:hypothetical protein
MTKQQFVEHFASLCDIVDGSVISALKEPPGRSPGVAAVQRSNWFRSLSPRDQENARDVVRYAVYSTMFSVLSELDGVGGVAGDRERGMFKLSYVEKGTEHPLTDQESDMLHELFAGYMT